MVKSANILSMTPRIGIQKDSNVSIQPSTPSRTLNLEERPGLLPYRKYTSYKGKNIASQISTQCCNHLNTLAIHLLYLIKPIYNS
uniref:Uncharacterized protein n=1 Tax=Cucumis melo TaxID=3656 RepID=A0A9I9EGU3_CUCME